MSRRKTKTSGLPPTQKSKLPQPEMSSIILPQVEETALIQMMNAIEAELWRRDLKKGWFYNTKSNEERWVLRGRHWMRNEYNRELIPAMDTIRDLLMKWYGLISRVHEAAQIGTGERLKQRLAMLAGELANAGTIYKNALLEHKNLYRHDPQSLQNIDQIISNVQGLTSAYQDFISDVIDGKATGDTMKAMHENYPDDGVHAFAFKPFNPDVNKGGRPAGKTIDVKTRLLERLKEFEIDHPNLNTDDELWRNFKLTLPMKRDPFTGKYNPLPEATVEDQEIFNYMSNIKNVSQWMVKNMRRIVSKNLFLESSD